MNKYILLGLGVLVGATFLLSTQIVWAHAELKSAKPAPGETVDQAPQTIELTFTEAMQTGDVMLYNIDNAQLATYLQPRDNSEMIVAEVDDELDEGEYKVFWQATSGDGHLISGSYNFAYQVPATDTIIDKPIFTVLASLILLIVLGTSSWIIYRRRVCATPTP